MAFTPTQSTAGRLGSRLGNTAGSILETIAQQKMQQLQQNQQIKAWEQVEGVDPKTARALVDLGVNPNDYLKSIMQYGRTANGNAVNVPQNIMQTLQSANPQEQLQQQNAQLQQSQQPEPFFKQVSKGKGVEKPLTPAQLKHQDTIRDHFNDLEDLYETTTRMLEDLNKGISVGGIANLQGKYLPTSLDKTSEQFAKDAAHIVNLTSKGQKGVQSKYRVQKIEEEKPGLQHSIPVNEQILKRYQEQALKGLKAVQKDYSDLGLDFQQPQQEQQGEELDAKPSAQEAGEGAIWINDNGSKEIVKNNKWIPYKG